MSKYCCNPNHNHVPGDHRPTDIWAPDRHSSINNTAFSAYVFHSQQIEDLINVLAAADDPNSESTQREAFDQVGLYPNDLTLDERNYIERKVEELYVKKNSTSFW